MSRKLSISTARNRYDHGLKVGAVSWDKLVKKLRTFTVTDETFEEYQAAGTEKLAIKDTGWFIGGPLKPARRRKANLQYRDVLSLDADHLDPWDVDTLIAHFQEKGYEFVVHSSHSHSEDEPRLRFIFPFARPVTPAEYEPIARWVAGEAGIDLFDDTTYQVSRVMFWPSRSKDGDEYSDHFSGAWLDPDAILDHYKDWKDWGSWPVSSREDQIARDPGARAEDPYSKPGAIGAFNRLFTIPHAIERFDLPYEPSGMGEDRYTYTQGSSVDGAIYYEDDGHLYSWHESDPARGNRNAWDLVRIHKFGHLDEDYNSDDIGRAPSQREMQSWAMKIDEVVDEVNAARASEEFEDLGPAEDGEEPTGEKKSKRSRLSEAAIRARITGSGSPLDDKERRGICTDIASANLTPAQIEVLASLIKSCHVDPAPSKKGILDEIKSIRHMMLAQTEEGDPVDIELDLIERVLDDWFEGGAHIRRFAKQFWTYEHGVWIRREDEWIRGKMQASFINLRRERPQEVAALVAAIGEVDTSAITGKLWQMFCAHLSATRQEEDPLRLMEPAEEPIINCLSGHIRFNRKGGVKLYPHDPEMFFTAQVPLEYDPNADRSHWNDFCELMFHDSVDPEDMQRHLEEVAGYIIQPWRQKASIFMMRGEPAAGKSTFAALLMRLLGRSAVSASMAKYGGQNNHAEAGLVGKLLLVDEDYTSGDLMPDGFLKTISDEVQLTANPKGKDEFSFICRSAPLIVCNDWPQTRDHSGAINRRVLAWDLPMIPLERQDADARRALLREGLPGAFAAFVAGFARFYKRNGWKLPGECELAAETWNLNADLVRLWIHECFEEDEDAMVRQSEMHGWFVHWYGDNVRNGTAMGRNKFLARLRTVLGTPGRDNDGVRVYRGLRYRGSDFEE